MRNWELLEKIKTLPCQVCGRRPVDPCHIRSVGSGGKDEPWNVIPMCRLHHREQHDKGWIKFLSTHRGVKVHLEARGWEIIDSVGKQKLWHPKLAEKDQNETELV